VSAANEPTHRPDNASVTVNEADPASNTGTFSDPGVDDDTRDVLTGGWGLDWFLANYQHDDEGRRDWITDLRGAEFADDLDWIEEEVLVEDPEV